jgi:uncharacterized membrane protein YagU involved in acid resistance
MIHEAVEGAAAGVGATTIMTAVMELGLKSLPPSLRYASPPREITEVVGQRAGLWRRLTEPQKQAATAASHFSYGSLMGAIYGVVARGRHRNYRTGAAFGLGVWAGSYLGLLPALGILAPATRHPAARNAVMIAAHLAWGVALAAALPDTEESSEQEDSPHAPSV